MATKPTPDEYDLVYVGLRPNAVDKYDLLRAWILSLTGGGGVFSVTYAQLQTAIAGSTLVPGSLYKINNFRTREIIPNTVPDVIQLGGVEAMYVMALTEDTLSTWAYSDKNPTDIIIYDIDNTNFGADMGRILYREDTINNLSAWYDFRECVFRRWDDGSGNFTILLDNGNAFADFPTFHFSALNCHIGVRNVPFTGHALNNIIIGENCTQISFDDNSFNCTVIGFCSNVQCGLRTELVILNLADAIRLGNDCSEITIIGASSFIIFSDGCFQIDIADACNNLVFAEQCENMTFDFDSARINIGAASKNLTFQSACKNITVGQNCDTILFDACEDINIGNSCFTLTLASASGYVFDAFVKNRNVAPANRFVNAHHSPNSAKIYCLWDFGSGGTNGVGTKLLDLIPEGAFCYINRYQGDTLVSGGASTIALGIQVDSASGILAATAYNNAVFNGAIQVGGQPIPTSGTTAERYLILTLAGADMTSGVVHFWTEVLINQNA